MELEPFPDIFPAHLNLNDETFFGLAVAVYGIGMVFSLLLWRRGFQKHDWIVYGILALGGVLHTVAVLWRGYEQGRCPVGNLFEVTSFILWVTVVGYSVLGLWPRLRFLGAFASPFLFGLALFATFLLFLKGDELAVTGQPEGWVSLHVTLIALAYGSLGLSFGGSLMYLSQERDLKFDKLRALISRLPPVEHLEKVMVRLLIAGLALLTVGLLSGLFGLKPPEGQSFWSDSKVIWSLLVWVAYAGLLVWYWRTQHAGHRLALANCVWFCFILLTFWGVNLLSTIHNQP